MPLLAWQTAEDLIALLQANPLYTTAIVAVTALTLVVLFPSLLSEPPPKKKALPKFLEPAEFKPVPLASKTFITHNTLRLRFTLPEATPRVGLPIGQHISFSAKGADGKDIIRSYTPVSDDDLLGAVEFVIKIYPTGKMSQVLNSLEVGQTMLMRGPKGRFQYAPNMKKHLGMVAGGSGITPMYQILMAILKNPEDKTKISLVYGNVTEADILLKDELEALSAKHSQQVKVYHVLNNPPSGWTMGSGFITPAILTAQLPAPGPGSLVLQCGPPPMVDAMKKHLEVLAYTEEMLFSF